MFSRKPSRTVTGAASELAVLPAEADEPDAVEDEDEDEDEQPARSSAAPIIAAAVTRRMS
jgi:hypothetical protein